MIKRKTRILSQVVTILAVLAMSAMQVVPVLADDEAPPPPTATEVGPPPEENPSSEAIFTEPPVTEVEEVAPEATPAETEAPEDAAVEEVPASTEQTPVVAEEPAAEPETPAEILAQVPEGTGVVVLDENGNALPLATQAAAETITGGDPIWCPVGVTPVASAGGCSMSYSNLKALVDDVGVSFFPAANGVIWITGFLTNGAGGPGVADSSATNIVFNGGLNSTWTTWSNYGLVLKGGWTGTGTTINTNDASVFNRTISITNWNGAITLSDMVISDVAGGQALTIVSTKDINLARVEIGTLSDPNTGTGALVQNAGGAGNITITDSKFSYNTGGTGLQVISSGVITLNNVNVDHNGSGASLNSAPGTGNVTVTNSQFSHNTAGTGLSVQSQGTITLNTVSASFNSAGGASLNNQPSETAKGVVLTSGILEFNDNGGTGLTILSDGAVSLKDITATGNGSNGANVDNRSGTAAITLTGTNIFSENATNGVALYSRRAITASNIIANANVSGWGIMIDNTAAGTSVNVGVTLTGSSQFNFNGAGVVITTLGAITLNNISVIGNASDGASLQNGTSPFNSAVKLTGTNVFNDNYDTGLNITSRGAVTLNNVTAISNGTIANSGQGALINNEATTAAQAVTLTGVNTFNDNYGGGLEVQSRGAITLNNVTAEGNEHGGGVLLDNSVIPTAPQNVTINGYITTNGNNGNGLEVTSYGLITLSNVTAIANSLDGAFLVNSGGTGATKTVTLSGNNTFNNNTMNGLVVQSRGAITVNNITADHNANGNGVSLNNIGGTGGITLNNTSTFSPSASYNGGTGIDAYSSGNIVIKDLNAIGNGEDGGVLNNTSGTAGNVTVGTSRLNWCNHFASNNDSGLDILSNGIVTLSNLCNDGNGDSTDPSPYGYGLLVDNSSLATPKAVTLLGVNTFNNNYNGGLFIASNGAVTLNKVTASDNRNGFGANIINSVAPLTPQNVTLNGYGNFSGNASFGLNIGTYGAVTLNNLLANDNSAYGTNIINGTGSLARNVTLNGYAEISSNSGAGLSIVSLGSIAIANLNASGNSSVGALLDNDTGSAAVTLTGHAWANDNAGAGLIIASKGSIAVANLSTWRNSGTGASLSNNPLGSTGTVTLTGSASAGGNTGSGIVIFSNRAITISNLTSQGNSGTGAQLNNGTSTAASPQNITILGYGTLSGNGDNGLDVDTYGVITLNNITANDNGWGPSATTGYGAVLNNFLTEGAAPKAVLLNGANTFNNNALTGVSVDTLGAITASNLTANGNTGTGVHLDNCQMGILACQGTGNITLTSANTFSGNGGDGLYIHSNGMVNLTKITANDNGDDGLIVMSHNNITLTCGSMTNNVNDGWSLNSPSSIVTLKGVFSYGNGLNTNIGSGTFVYVRACPLP